MGELVQARMFLTCTSSFFREGGLWGGGGAFVPCVFFSGSLNVCEFFFAIVA